MYRTLTLYRTNVKVSNFAANLTLAQVQQAFTARVEYSPSRKYNLVMPRFKTPPGADSYITILNSGAVTEIAKDNYENWNWGRLPIFIPDMASAIDFHFCPSHTIPYSENEILLLLVPAARSGIAFVQGYDTPSGEYQCLSRFFFTYSGNTVSSVTNSVLNGSYGFLGYRYAPNSNTLHIGISVFCESMNGVTSSRMMYQLASGQAKNATIFSYTTITSLTTPMLAFFGASSVDEMSPTDANMDALVSIDGKNTFQLYADTNYKSYSGRAQFIDMSQMGLIQGMKVTLDFNKLDPFYLNAADYYEAYNTSVANRGSRHYVYFQYATGEWKSWVPSYIKRLLACGLGGTVLPGGGNNTTAFNALLKISGNTLTEAPYLSNIPNPATTANNARGYMNVALCSTKAPETYFPGTTQGSIAVENADPKWFRIAMEQECYRRDSSYSSTTTKFGTGYIPCRGGTFYWQDTQLNTNGLTLYIDKNTNKAIVFNVDTSAYQGSIYYHFGASFTTGWARLYDYDDTFAAWYGGSADNPSDPTDVPDPNDYNPNGPTVPEMNPGSFDDSSDAIPLPDRPTISVVDAGLITLFNPTLSQLQALSKYMWSDMTTASGWFDAARKIFADPMQYFIALNILPFDVPSGSTVTVKLAGISTGVSMTKAANQFVDIDCGSYALNEYWGSALDYAPSTKIWCFLPFVGSVPLDPDMVMKSTIRIVYRTDILTGAFVAFILANENVLYHFNGNMATNVPLTGADYSRLVSAIIGAASTIALTAGAAGAAGQAAMGVGAARAGLQAASAGMNQAISTVQAHAPSFGASMMRGGTTGIAGDMFQMLQANADELTQAGRNMGKATAARNAASGAMAASGVHAVHNTVNAVMAAKPSIAISGQMSGCSGLMDIQYPYLIIQRPNQALPENYKHYVGYPSHMLADVQSCRGYTVFEQIELSGIPCTDDELAEINDILKGGFYG